MLWSFAFFFLPVKISAQHRKGHSVMIYFQLFSHPLHPLSRFQVPERNLLMCNLGNAFEFACTGFCTCPLFSSPAFHTSTPHTLSSALCRQRQGYSDLQCTTHVGPQRATAVCMSHPQVCAIMCIYTDDLWEFDFTEDRFQIVSILMCAYTVKPPPAANNSVVFECFKTCAWTFINSRCVIFGSDRCFQ